MDLVADMDSDVNTGLYYASLVTDAIISLFLTLSLNHQFRFRSTAKPPPQRQGSVKSTGSKGRNGQEQAPDVDSYQRFRMSFIAVLSFESIFFILFVLHLVFLYLNM